MTCAPCAHGVSTRTKTYCLGMSCQHARNPGCFNKENIIYELELLAAVLAYSVWSGVSKSHMITWFGDNDSVRFSLIRGTGTGSWGESLMEFHFKNEVDLNALSWFARVPTEASISDWPSRMCKHELLKDLDECSTLARETFLSLKNFVQLYVRELETERGSGCRAPIVAKRRVHSA